MANFLRLVIPEDFFFSMLASRPVLVDRPVWSACRSAAGERPLAAFSKRPIIRSPVRQKDFYRCRNIQMRRIPRFFPRVRRTEADQDKEERI